MGLSTLRNLATAIRENNVLQLVTDIIATGGVLDLGSNNHFQVTAQSPTAMAVNVNTGRAYIGTPFTTNVYPVLNDAVIAASITSNSSGNSRIDSVVLYINLGASSNADASNIASVAVVAGTPAGSPVAPNNAAILAAIGAYPYIVLANVTVTSGAVAIVAGNISDQRNSVIFTKLGKELAGSLCPFVYSGLTIATSASLVQTNVAGYAFYGGQLYFIPADLAHTYTASKDTYVDVNPATGAYTYSVVSNGAAAPAITASCIRIAKVVSGASSITSVVQDGSFDSLQNIIYPFDPQAILAQYYTPAGGATATLVFVSGNQIFKRHVIQMPAGNITIALPTGYIPQYFEIEIIQDGVGSRTVTWFTTINWTAPTLTATASKKDAFGFLNRITGSFDGYTIGQGL